MDYRFPGFGALRPVFKSLRTLTLVMPRYTIVGRAQLQELIDIAPSHLQQLQLWPEPKSYSHLMCSEEVADHENCRNRLAQALRRRLPALQVTIDGDEWNGLQECQYCGPVNDGHEWDQQD